MTTTSSFSNKVRETDKEAREASKPAFETSSAIQNDLQTLRDEFKRLAEQVGDVITAKGSAAWQHARPSVDSVVSDAQKKGREAVDAVGDVSDNFVAAIDESIKNRPYTTLAIFAGLGFVLGAMWRR